MVFLFAYVKLEPSEDFDRISLAAADDVSALAGIETPTSASGNKAAQRRYLCSD